jgi:hypothetical protein
LDLFLFELFFFSFELCNFLSELVFNFDSLRKPHDEETKQLQWLFGVLEGSNEQFGHLKHLLQQLNRQLIAFTDNSKDNVGSLGAEL